MSSDGVALANIRNRIHKSNLITKLQHIEREKKAELRMHDTAKQRFVSKYAKLDNYIQKGKEVSDVKLYETHTPGFCYRRNGEYRTPPAPSTSSPVDFKDIHALLFTNEDVDIDKVLCLHVISAHLTETLTPPQKNQRALSFIAKELSPVERLIERSKKKPLPEDKLTKQIPRYILEITERPDEEGKRKNNVVIRDGRLAARVIINDKIHQLVQTVLHALHNSNLAKLNEFFVKAKDPDRLMEILEKPSIQTFLDSLHENELVTSCESFRLTQPFKTSTVSLVIDRASNNSLQRLVNKIRRSVLQVPAAVTNLYAKDPPITKRTLIKSKENVDYLIENALAAMSDTKKIKKKTSLKKESTGTKEIYKNEKQANSIESNKTANNVIFDDVSVGKSTGIGSVELENEDRASPVPSTTSKLSEKQTLQNKGSKISKGSAESTSGSTYTTESQNTKYTIKQMKCPACTQRWKIPLPSPKIPSLVKYVVPTLDQKTYKQLASSSTVKLAALIENEIKKPTTTKQTRKKDQGLQGSILDRNYMPNSVELDVLDLTRISQEIKEKETQKKLDNFLKNTV